MSGINKKLKIFDYCYHIPHQWDMVNALKDDCEFYYCLNVKQHWDFSKRPLPDCIKFITHYEEGVYDLAILHVDQQTILFDQPKYLVYNHFNKTIKDIPKVVINHGSPVFPELFWESDCRLSEEETQKKCIDLIKKLIGNNYMVVNSYDSASSKEWGFGIPIIHGMDPLEWLDLPKEPRVFTAIPPHGFDTYYNRAIMRQVVDILYENYNYIIHYAGVNVDTSQSWQSYKEYLGRSLLYLDTSFRTPMNRARTEAFLSGCCVIQVEGAHDLDRWADQNENIIIVPNNPETIAHTIVEFLENRYQDAISLGKKGKEMAIREFSRSRYREDWLELINTILKYN